MLSGGIPKLDTAIRIAEALNLSPAWLLTGQGHPQTSAVHEQEAAYDVGVEFALIPRYDVEAAAGPGKSVQVESEIGKMAFRRDWLRQKGLTPKDLVMIRIDGDSMSPTIRDGSLALVDTADAGPHKDGVYVLMVDGDLVAKRLQRDLAAGGLYIRSDNPAYREQLLTSAEAEHLFIIGRLVWSGGEL